MSEIADQITKREEAAKAEADRKAQWAALVENRRISVKARYIGALLPFVSTEHARYYLNGIYMQPHPAGGVLMTACNGHILGTIYDATARMAGEACICAVPREIAVAADKFRRSGDVHFVRDVAYVTSINWFESDQTAGMDPSAIGENHAAIAYAPPIDGQYPEYARVFPKQDKQGAARRICFNPSLVKAFEKVVTAIHGPKSPYGITLFHGDDGDDQRSPQLVRIDGVPEFVGVLMPMRDSVTESHPHWLEPFMPKPAAEPAAEQAAAS